MTASGLRREAEKGRLAIERVAGKDYTTLAAIEEMRASCRVLQKAHAFGFAPQNIIRTERSESERFGSSETDRARSARAALQKIARSPNAHSANTLPRSTSQAAGAAVIPLKS
jgi:hypothetical protein